ncbi:TOBE domain-containing protein [Sphingomonas aerolata]|uniref:TOBE domain-containing protein n=1 Tax=Sphingomonas aerolata TaxID=185951 RepID=UPI002FDFCF5C
MLPATIASVDADGTSVRLAGGETVRTGAIVPADAVGSPVTLGVRPEHLHVDDAGPFVGAVELFERLGPLSFAHLGARGAADTIVAQLPGTARSRLAKSCGSALPRRRACVRRRWPRLSLHAAAQ